MTECKTKRFEFHALSNREVIAHFDGGDISSDAGGLLLREVEQRTGILKQFAECFTDYRKPEWIEHPVQDLLAQKAYALCLGFYIFCGEFLLSAKLRTSDVDPAKGALEDLKLSLIHI